MSDDPALSGHPWKPRRRGKQGKSSHTAYFHETLRHILIHHMDKYERGYETIVNLMLEHASKSGIEERMYDRLVEFWRPEYIRAIVKTGRFVAEDMLEPLVNFLSEAEPERSKLLDETSSLVRYGETLADLMIPRVFQEPYTQAELREQFKIINTFLVGPASAGDHAEFDVYSTSRFMRFQLVPGQIFLKVQSVRVEPPFDVCNGIAVLGESCAWCFIRESSRKRRPHIWVLFPSDGRYLSPPDTMTVITFRMDRDLSGLVDYDILHAPLSDWLLEVIPKQLQDVIGENEHAFVGLNYSERTPRVMGGARIFPKDHESYSIIENMFDRMGW